MTIVKFAILNYIVKGLYDLKDYGLKKEIFVFKNKLD